MVKEYNIYKARNFPIKFNLDNIIKTPIKYQFLLKGQINGENGEWIEIGTFQIYCKNLKQLKMMLSEHIIKVLKEKLKWEEE